MNKKYETLRQTLKPAAQLHSCSRLLEWDQETNMPPEGIHLRSEQNKLVHELIHKIKTSKKYATQLSELIDLDSGAVKTSDLSFEEKACLRELKRDYLHEKKLSTTFIKKFAEATTNGLDAWKKAKKNDSFKDFLPYLNKIVTLTRKKADLLGYKEHPYDALLDLFEPDVTVAKIDAIFIPLKKRLVTLLEKIQSKGRAIDPNLLKGHFPIDKQKALSHEVIQDMGLTKANYNLAETAHPFCSSLSPQDIRMTTHFYEEDFTNAFFATIHECGHGLYEHHLPIEHFGTPLAEAASHGVHESQSRIWETFIAQSKPFWQFYFPKLQKAFPDAFTKTRLEDFYNAINEVKPSFIRIFADEVTYNLHIVLRYEIEKALIDGSLQVKDIPEAWNAKMQSYLGIIPKNFREGCLQDIHWSLGLFGYFPSYTLGNLFAGALHFNLNKTYPDFQKRIASGDLKFITAYLKDKIHRHGRTYPPIELIERAIGTKFSAEPYLSYLELKYA